MDRMVGALVERTCEARAMASRSIVAGLGVALDALDAVVEEILRVFVLLPILENVLDRDPIIALAAAAAAAAEDTDGVDGICCGCGSGCATT